MPCLFPRNLAAIDALLAAVDNFARPTTSGCSILNRTPQSLKRDKNDFALHVKTKDRVRT